MRLLLRRAMTCAAFALVMAAPGLCGEAKTYDDPYQQTVDVDQQKLDHLQGKVGVDADARGDAEQALGQLRGAVEEHNSIYTQYAEDIGDRSIHVTIHGPEAAMRIALRTPGLGAPRSNALVVPN